MRKIITLEEIIEKLTEKEEKKIKVTQVEVQEFGLIEFIRPKDDKIIEYVADIAKAVEQEEEISNISEDETTEKNLKKIKKIDLKQLLEASSKFVYQCCPLLQKKEIRDMYKGAIPYEIPGQIFGMNETIELASKLIDIFEGKKATTETIETVKN